MGVDGGVGEGGLTLLPHVHVMDLAVAVLGLADAAVGQRVAGVVRVHAEVEVVTRVGHSELVGGARERAGERETDVRVLWKKN